MGEDYYPGDEVFDKIEELCDKGEDDLERGKPRAALKRFFKALELLPDPATQYPAGTWLLVNIGDIYYYWEQYERALERFAQALDYFEGADNPFIHLRIGQCQYHLGQPEAAKAAFAKAYELDGAAIFEEEEAIYWDFFKGSA